MFIVLSRQTYADYRRHRVNNALAEKTEELVKRGLKRGSLVWIIENFKLIKEVEKELNVKLDWDYKKEFEDVGFLKGSKALIGYFIFKIGF